jgi:hypothetical protein
MPSFGMLHRVTHITTDVSDEDIAFIVRVTRIAVLGTTLTVTSNGNTLRRKNVCHPDEGADTFLRRVCSYKSHTA